MRSEVEILAERLRFLCCVNVQGLDPRDIRPFSKSAGRDGWMTVARTLMEVRDEKVDALTAEVAALKGALRMAVDEWWGRIERMENAVESYLAQTDADNPAREALAYPCCAVTAEPGMRDLLARINTLLGDNR